MSTILKSLKKLEQQKEERQYTGPVADYHGPGSLTMHGVKHSWIKSVWFRRSLVAMIIIGLGVSSLYFYKQSQDTQHQAGVDNPPPLTAKNTSKRPQQKAPSPEGGRDVEVTPRKPPITKQERINETRPAGAVKRTPSTPRKFQSPPASANAKTESSAKAQRPSISREDDVRSDAKSVKRPAPMATRQRANAQSPTQSVAKSSPSRQTAPKPVKKAPAKQPVESYQNVSALTDGRLKVQAIVWSRIAEDRMTVINSRVLHEGDTVDAFTLVVIRPDDVVVKESGGAKWKVVFGRP